MTPEGRVKAEIRKIIKSYGDQIWSFWPVQTGYGRKTVDLLMCVRGQSFIIEVKAPGEKPTAMQYGELARHAKAGGQSTWFDRADNFHMFLKIRFPDLRPTE